MPGTDGLFGQRFTVIYGDMEAMTDHCGRCGMPLSNKTGKTNSHDKEVRR